MFEEVVTVNWTCDKCGKRTSVVGDEFPDGWSTMADGETHQCRECCTDEGTPAERLIGQIEAQCRIAREALAEEHEGNFHRAVMFIDADATRLAEFVAGW